MSNLVDLEKVAVRGLWFKHDLLSDFCSSFDPPCEPTYVDLKTSTQNEWLVRREIADKRVKAMRKLREEYEEKMREKAEAEGKGGAVKVEEVKSSKVKFKADKEPPIVDDSYVDVDEEYLEYEDNVFEGELESFSPDNLELTKNEVNFIDLKSC